MNAKIVLEIGFEMFKFGRSLVRAHRNAKTEKEKQELADALKAHDLAKINEIISK